MNLKIIKHLYEDIELEGFDYALRHYRDYSDIKEICPELHSLIESYKKTEEESKEEEELAEQINNLLG